MRNPNSPFGTQVQQFKALSVSDLNRQARQLLENSFMTVRVAGEISNLAKPASGHWYFTLKDAKAQVRCAMFRNRAMYVKPAPKSGDHVVITAKVSLYEGRGDFQLIAEHMESAGDGALQQAFDLLKAKLDQEGLFSQSHKKPVPTQAKHLGIVTSATGAALHDILTVTKRRHPGLRISVYPTQVQGSEATAHIVRAIATANRHNACDVLIVGRGGGSKEDLWCFNEEAVARAIFASQIPVISAVGHEVDVVISDLVADLRAPTPSAAAELVTPDQRQLLAHLNQIKQRLSLSLSRQLKQKQLHVAHLRSRLRSPKDHLAQQQQRLDRADLALKAQMQQRLQQQQQSLAYLAKRLERVSPEIRLSQNQGALVALEQRLQQAMTQRLTQYQQQLRLMATRLNSVSPLATLERGYAIVLDENQKALESSEALKPGDTITGKLRYGGFTARVTETSS